ncbi:MAG: hypothetical protein CM1200mP36_07350 [Gammaproteobacteria bacterium]|nr:MAG: hypothetical protein CM1200mP36_07350 [Gammaproteobacteria bacterium]
MAKQPVHTDEHRRPLGRTVRLFGRVRRCISQGRSPWTQRLWSWWGRSRRSNTQVFDNLAAGAEAAGGGLADVVKITVYLRIWENFRTRE